MKFKSKMLIISLMLLILLGISAVSAGENETLLADGDGEVLTSENEEIQMDCENVDFINSSDEDILSSNAFGDLNSKIRTADEDSEIKLDQDYTRGDGENTLIEISKSIRIDGDGHKISSDSNYGIFIINDPGHDISVTLKNLVLKNGKSNYGGAIYVDTGYKVDLTIINCRFDGNGAYDKGGAIYYKPNENSQLKITDSTFTYNSVDKGGMRDSDGGAIAAYRSFAIIESSEFAYNSAYDDGGAIYSEAALTVRDSTFRLNGENTKKGGAIYNNDYDDTDFTISNTVFQSNSAVDGGAVYIDSDSKTVVENCVFDSNEAKSLTSADSGGAIYMDGANELYLTNSRFVKNSASSSSQSTTSRIGNDIKGGAVYSVNNVILEGCHFEDNYAIDHGGAIFTSKVLKWGNTHSTFKNNKVNNENYAVVNKGGAIYANTIENTVKGIFIENDAYYGGAIYVNSACHVNVESSYFESNVAKSYSGSSGCGAAIYMDSASSQLTLRYNCFIDNDAAEDYAVYNCGSYESVEYNWWGSNSPNFNEPYLVEWHRFGSNDKHSDGHVLRLSIEKDKEMSSPSDDVTLTLKFKTPEGLDLTDRLSNVKATYAAIYPATFTPIDNSTLKVAFRPLDYGDYSIEATVNNQKVSISLIVEGEFTMLQHLINEASLFLILERDFTYSDIDNMPNGVVIDKPLVIDGNGHKIDAKLMAQIFKISSSELNLKNITFLNSNGPAIYFDDVNNIFIDGCKFINNTASGRGAAIYSNLGDFLSVSDSYFEGNVAQEDGGAVYINTRNSKITGSTFIKNTGMNGGAIIVASESVNLTVQGSVFTSNSASNRGGAIYWLGADGCISDSNFTSNRAKSKNLTYKIEDKTLILTLTGEENYINAIYSDDAFISNDIRFSNVGYWNGEFTTTDNPVKSNNASGQIINIGTIDENENRQYITLRTDDNGQARYDFSELEDGQYNFTAFHSDDEYYSLIQTEGDLDLERLLVNSSVKINIEDGAEFEYGKCNISFAVENRTTVRVVISYDSGILDNVTTDLDYYIVTLPGDDEYTITVYNLGNETHKTTSDSKKFSILKGDSTITIDPIEANFRYGEDMTISFSGDTASYNVTVYDDVGNVEFSQIVNAQSVTLPNLEVGEHNITIINLGDDGKYESVNSTIFTVEKGLNEVLVMVDDSYYGEGVTVTVIANADGQYIVDINSTLVEVNVVNGEGKNSTVLGIGEYYANATFHDDNYDSDITNTTFSVRKAISRVSLFEFEAEPGKDFTVVFSDLYPLVYNVTIYDEPDHINYTAIIDTTSFELPVLNEGSYNLTVTNLGNENVTGSTDSVIFEVSVKNVVRVLVNTTYYGDNISIAVYADVDGYYQVHIGDDEFTVEVLNGFGRYDAKLSLGIGEYSANVTYDNPFTKNVLINTTFSVTKIKPVVLTDIVGNELKVAVSDGATGDVSLTVNNSTLTQKLQNGAVTFNLDDLSAGKYTAVVSYMGDAYHIGLTKTVEIPIEIVIIASDSRYGWANTINYQVKVLDENSTGKSGVEVTFVVDGKTFKVVADANGIAGVALNLKVGTYSISVSTMSNYTTTKKITVVNRLVENRNVNMYYFDGTTFKVRAIGDDGNAVAAGQIVEIKLNKKTYKLKTDKNGFATLKIPNTVKPGKYSLTATYKGQTVKNTVVVKQNLKLKKVTVKRSAKKLTLTATLKNGKKALKGKKVVFKFKGKKYTAKTNKKGIAKVTIKKKVLKKLKKGKKVTYQVTYLKNTVKRTAKVKR